MARSYYYNDSKLNQYIQPRIKKDYNYTYQKLVQEEISIKQKIENESKTIKKIELDIQKGREIQDKYSEQQRLLENEIQREQRHQRTKLENDGDISPQSDLTKKILLMVEI